VIGESPIESDPQQEDRESQESAAGQRHPQDVSERHPQDASEQFREGPSGGRPADGPTANAASANAALGEPLVAITLSRNQVEHVLRAAFGEDAVPSIARAMASTGFHRAHAKQLLSSRYSALQENRRLSRSLLAGLLVLSCFPREGVDVGIKDISEQLQLNTSTVHRYVLTLVAAGLLERDPDTRRYRLLPE
jgi:hypothetical protein